MPGSGVVMNDLTLGDGGGRGTEGVLVVGIEKEGTGGMLREGVSGGAADEG